MPATNKRLGTLHDLRFVISDNDARPLLATAHDGDWTPRSTTSSAWSRRDRPTVRGTRRLVGHSRPVGQGLRRQLYQLTADSWYCAYLDAAVRDMRRGQGIATGINELQKVKPTEVVTDAAAI